jgi:hypothetical protein
MGENLQILNMKFQQQFNFSNPLNILYIINNVQNRNLWLLKESLPIFDTQEDGHVCYLNKDHSGKKPYRL